MEGTNYYAAIREKIYSWPIGTIFTLNDLAEYGTYDSVRKALSRIAKLGLIQRLMSGVYWWMPQENLKTVEYPKMEDVLQVLAKSNNWIVMPGTELCRHKLGLSKMRRPEDNVYLSTGPSGVYQYGDGTVFSLQHCGSKLMTLMSKDVACVTIALMDLMNHKITAEDVMHLATTLDPHTKQLMMQERAFAPARLRCVFEIICGEYGTGAAK